MNFCKYYQHNIESSHTAFEKLTVGRILYHSLLLYTLVLGVSIVKLLMLKKQKKSVHSLELTTLKEHCGYQRMV